jgi:hypothetical protein
VVSTLICIKDSIILYANKDFTKRIDTLVKNAQLTTRINPDSLKNKHDKKIPVLLGKKQGWVVFNQKKLQVK